MCFKIQYFYSVEDKTKMLEILERVAKENEVLVEDDDSDCSNDPLEERLAGIDLGMAMIMLLCLKSHSCY